MQPSSELTPQQRIALGVVVVIGLATLVFALLNIRRMIFSPFERDPSLVGTFKTSSQVEEERFQQLKTLDTDGDTLTDYDELYVFLTSPYLEDTDGDGDFDGVEIAANTDPKCPKGKDCATLTPSSAASGQTATVPGADEAPVPDTIQALIDVFGADIASLTMEKAEVRLRQLKSAELRQFMTRLGLPEDVITKADDSVLISLLLETLRETGMPTQAEAQKLSAEAAAAE